jgi:(R,R)-butanediol dehydrogenase/meso-butanediol dehydrogenase/diacetyl reductase
MPCGVPLYRIMRAIYLHGPDDLRLRDVDRRSVSEGTVRVDIGYTGICGSDLHEYNSGPTPIRKPEDNHSIPESEWDEYLPKPMGHEIAGEISQVGTGVDTVDVGDRVALNMVFGCHDCRYCAEGKYHLCERGSGGVVSSRGFAESIVVPASMAVPVPESVSLQEAALAEPLGVSLHGVRRSEIGVGDRIAVFGAGPIGLGVVAGAKAAGAREIYVSEPKASRREAAKALGADVVIDPAESDPVERIKRDTDRVEISFECAGTETTLTDSLRSTAYGGTVVVLSVFEENASIHPNDIMQSERELVGSFAFQGGPLSSRSEFVAAMDMIADGRIDPDPFVTDVVPLEDVDAAFESLLEPDSDHIKILVEP